ncbi:MAG: RHS repeat-associated core domain-containing protein [Bacteroidota bacterium]
MGCLKLTYDQQREPSPFLGIWKRDRLKESESHFFEGLDQKRGQQKNCINYYPGGFTFNEHQRTASVENKWKFQSKEWLPELRVYDFGPRGWDPLIRRTNAQDILANKFPDQSPYSLFRNNPIRYTDPDGRAPIDSNCPNCVADDQVLSLLYLNFIAARKNVANTIAGFIKAGLNVPFIFRNEFSVMTGEDGVPFLYESGPQITDKLSAAVFGAIDGASLIPNNVTGFVAKNGAGPTLGSNIKNVAKSFLDSKGFSGLSNTGTVNPYSIRFS